MEYKQKTLYEHVTERWTECESSYGRLQTARTHICDFFRPDLGVDYDKSHDMLMLGGDIYDGSGPWVARTAAMAFMGNSVNKRGDWWKYQYTDKRVEGVDELDEHAQAQKEHISHVYQRGNFYDVQPQFTLDGWTIGGPLHFIEEDPETGFVMCIPAHWMSYRIFYDRFNRSNGVIVKDTQWTAKKCFDKFCPGKDIQTRLAKAEKIFSINLFTAIRQGNWNNRVTIWRAVFKANDPIWETEGFERPVSSPFNPKTWYDVYFEDIQRPGVRQTKPLLMGGYYSKPFVHWDYDKKPWETASRTPAFAAMYDNLSLQQIMKLFLDDLKMAVRPAMAVLTGHKGRIDFSSEGENYFNSNEWNFLPKPIERVGNIKLEPETMDRVRENLSRHFHLEMFRMFTDLAQAPGGKEFKVMQIAEMAGERMTTLLPTIESHENYLAQVDARVRDIERQAGRGPYNRADMENVLDILEWALDGDVQGVGLAPEFMGTLRQTQQTQQRLKPIQYAVGALAEIGAATGNPNLARFMLKDYELADEALTAVNCPQKLIREAKDYEQIVAQFEQGVAQDKRFAQMVELMKATKSVTSAVAPDSIMAQLAGATA